MAAVAFVTGVRILNDGVAQVDDNVSGTNKQLTAYKLQSNEFAPDVAGHVYGRVRVPRNVNATPNASIILTMEWPASSPGVSRMKVRYSPIADTESWNSASLTAVTSQDVTCPATAYTRKDLAFALTGVEGDDEIVLDIQHEGDHANDTCTCASVLIGAYLKCDCDFA